jgi:hypothetical protein
MKKHVCYVLLLAILCTQYALVIGQTSMPELSTAEQKRNATNRTERMTPTQRDNYRKRKREEKQRQKLRKQNEIVHETKYGVTIDFVAAKAFEAEQEQRREAARIRYREKKASDPTLTERAKLRGSVSYIMANPTKQSIDERIAKAVTKASGSGLLEYEVARTIAEKSHRRIAAGSTRKPRRSQSKKMKKGMLAEGGVGPSKPA